MEKINILSDMNDKQLRKALLETIEELEKNKDKVFRKGLEKRIKKIKDVVVFNWMSKNLDDNTIQRLSKEVI